MALPSSGPISAGMINMELGRSGIAPFNINGAAERALAGRPTGSISLSHFLGKSAWDGGRALAWTAGSSFGAASYITSQINIYSTGIVVGSYSTSTSGAGREIGRWTPSDAADATECRWVRVSGGQPVGGTPEAVWARLSDGYLSVLCRDSTVTVRFEFRRGSIDLGSVNFTIYS